MESKHTIESPLNITWDNQGGKYKVNKPSVWNESLVSLDYAYELLKQRDELLEALKSTTLLNLEQYADGTIGNRIHKTISNAIKSCTK